ncbi:MAG: glycosyltransferase family 8 protein [Desulfovibrio sp.]|jgi:lipopolysaccharide biosynthesis glycosyltransferase|nr:glycosyltransferase family 8 protein [Desulfovibrio sp.]
MLIPVIFPTDNNYVPVCAAFFASFAAHASPVHEYRLIGIVENLTREQEESLAALLRPYPWCGVSFKDMSGVEIPFLENRTDFPRASYFNLDIPNLFPEYDKIIYMDSDTIVRADVAEIFALDLDGVYAATCPDSNAFATLHDAWGEGGRYSGADNWEYWLQYMELPEQAARNYFNNGVMVWNLEKTREDGLAEYMRGLLFSKPFYMADQDVMNAAFAGKTRILPQRWNFLAYTEDTADFRAWERHAEYLEAAQNPAVIHFAGPKPWTAKDVPYAEEFWKYSRLTPYYAAMRRLQRRNAVNRLLRPCREFLANTVFSLRLWAKSVCPGLYSAIRPAYRKLTGKKDADR